MFGYKLRWVTSGIAVGAAPSSKSSFNTIRKNGIEVILNLCAECGNLHERERATGFIVYWLPISDAYIPELDELDEAVDWLIDHIDSGRKVLVHCRFGVGRSGTIIAAYLLKRGHSLKGVFEKMKQMPAAPTNRDQIQLISNYAEKLTRLNNWP